MKKIILLVAAIVLLCLGGVAQADSISYTVGSWSQQFPGPVTPPAGAPWGTNGYPGDTVGLTGYVGSLDLTPDTYTLKINTLTWKIDYTYAGTETAWDYPDHWSDLSFSFPALRAISFGGGPTNFLSQNGLLKSTWYNDYLSFSDGSTTTVFLLPYKIDITPLGLSEVEGSNFNGQNPWTQPSRDVMARFEVTLTSPIAMKQQVLDELVALYATLTDKEDRDKLSDAIEHLQKSLKPDRWLDDSHPKPGSKGEGVFNEEKPVVNKLKQLRNNNDSGLDAALMQGYIDLLLATDRWLAEIAIAEAIASGGKADKIRTANEELIKGDGEAAKDHPDKAIDHYKNAWKNAIAA